MGPAPGSSAFAVSSPSDPRRWEWSCSHGFGVQVGLSLGSWVCSITWHHGTEPWSKPLPAPWPGPWPRSLPGALLQPWPRPWAGPWPGPWPRPWPEPRQGPFSQSLCHGLVRALVSALAKALGRALVQVCFMACAQLGPRSLAGGPGALARTLCDETNSGPMINYMCTSPSCHYTRNCSYHFWNITLHAGSA